MIDVSGTATFASGSALVLDSSLAAPGQAAYNVLTAANIVDNGLTLTPGGPNRSSMAETARSSRWVRFARSLGHRRRRTRRGRRRRRPATGTARCRISRPTPRRRRRRDVSASTAIGRRRLCRGPDGTGSYTVTVSGTQSAESVPIARGNVTLTGGTLAVGNFDVAAGATGTIASTVTGGATGKRHQDRRRHPDPHQHQHLHRRHDRRTPARSSSTACTSDADGP